MTNTMWQLQDIMEEDLLYIITLYVYFTESLHMPYDIAYWLELFIN